MSKTNLIKDDCVHVIDNGYIAFNENFLPFYFDNNINFVGNISGNEDANTIIHITRKIRESLNIIELNDEYMSLLSRNPHNHKDNVQDKINLIENFISFKSKYNIGSDKFNFLNVYTYNVNYYNFLQRLGKYYSGINCVYTALNINNIYKVNKLFIGNLNIIQKVSSDELNENYKQFLNRAYKFNKKNNQENCLDNVFLYISDINNFHHENTMRFDIFSLEQMLLRHNFTYLDLLYVTDKDKWLLNSDTAILMWGENMYSNINLLSYWSGKKILLFCPFAHYYEWTSDLIFDNSAKGIKIYDCKYGSENRYVYKDDIIFGNFVRFVIIYNENNDYVDENLFSLILSEYYTDFKYMKMSEQLCALKKNFSYNFLELLHDFIHVEKKLAINIFWKKIGYENIHLFYESPNVDLDILFYFLIKQLCVDTLEQLLLKCNVVDNIRYAKNLKKLELSN